MMKRMIFMLYLILLFSDNAFAQNNLVINEFLASNLNWNVDDHGEYDDWIEIYNPTAQPLDLAGYYLTDKYSDLVKWQIPAGYTDSTTVPAGGYRILWADSQPEQGPLHLGFKLSSSGEQIALVEKEGVSIIDSIRFDQQQTDVSMGRYPDGQSTWRFYKQPTPYLTNLEGFLGIADPPSFSANGGIFSGNKAISLDVDDANSVVRYTLDGSEPTTVSRLYTEPILFDSTTTIRARAFKDNYIPSNVVTNTYIKNIGSNLPILSVVTEPVNLWNDKTGIYVNYEGRGMEWERVVYNQYFKKNALQFSLKSGIRIQGSTSRSMDKKSFRLFFRKHYGQDRLEYDMFLNSTVNSFENLVLRAGYDDDLTTSKGTLLRDPLVSELWRQLGQLTSLGNFAILYLNNTYWGIYNIRESINKHFIQDHLDYQDFDLIRYVKDSVEVKYGTIDDWQELNDFFNNNDFREDSVYEAAKKRIDIDNFTTLQALVHGTEYNSWGYGVFAIKERTPGAKWQWTIWDMDRAYSLVDRNVYEEYYKTTGFHWYNLMLDRLLQNESYKRYFINRLSDLLNTLFRPENVIAVIDSLAAIVESEIPAETDRWNSSVSRWQWNIQNLRDFANERPAIVRNQTVDYFKLDRQHELTVDVSASGGKIQVNSIDVKDFPWQGIYFEGIPVTIRALPFPGYRFTGWSDPGIPNSSRINLNLKKDVHLTAKFERESSGECFEIIAPGKMKKHERLPLVVIVRSNDNNINAGITKEVKLKTLNALNDSLVKIKKGVGTLNPQILGDESFELWVEDNLFSSELKAIQIGENFPTHQYAGTLNDGTITWDSTFDRHITADLTIPANTELVIQSGTRILIDHKVNIFVHGNIQVNGSKSNPVLITSSSPEHAWGGIEFDNTAIHMNYCFFTNGGGDPEKAWEHCSEYNVQPILFAKDDAEFYLDNVFILFSPTGKAIGSHKSKINVNQCVISNVFHGGEFHYTLLQYQNSHIMNIPNDDGIFVDNDNDGMHIDYVYRGANKPSLIENCYYISGKDDAIDQNEANLEIKNTWIEDWMHEGVAASGDNSVYIYNVLTKGCDHGFEAGWGSPNVIIDHCVAIENNEGIRFGDNYQTPDTGHITVTNTIAYGNKDNIRNYTEQLQGPYEDAIDISYSMTNDPDYDHYPNCIASVPLFDESYHLIAGSPGVGAGLHGSNMGLVASTTAQTDPIVINEIMYNPYDYHDSQDWIELYNPQAVAQDLSGWLLKDEREKNSFYLPQGTSLAPNGYLVLCQYISEFKKFHPDVNNIIGDFVFSFGHVGGDQVRLFSADGHLIDFVKYGVESPWPTEPDSRGPSLELVNYTRDNNVAENWKASIVMYGTPGKKNSIVVSYPTVNWADPNSVNFTCLVGIESAISIADIVIDSANIDSISFSSSNSNLQLGQGEDSLRFTALTDSVFEFKGIAWSAGDTASISPIYTFTSLKVEVIWANPDSVDFASLVNIESAIPIAAIVIDSVNIDSIIFSGNNQNLQLIQVEDTLRLTANTDSIFEFKAIAWSFGESVSVSPIYKFKSLTADVSGELEAIPTKFSLSQNYPNPFNPKTIIRYNLPGDANVILKIYNVYGQHVTTLVNSYQKAGTKSIIWNGKDELGQIVSSGIYIYDLQADSERQIRKMLFLR